MRHANDLKFDLALVSRDLKFCRLSNGLFFNLGETCFCSEWQARVNQLQLPKAQDCEWATFPVALRRASPSSQPRLLASQPESAQIHFPGWDFIWILGTPISSVGHSISNETFDIEDFDIECSSDIDVFYIRYHISISKVFDIECHTRYRR
jgi:hypothetical protein